MADNGRGAMTDAARVESAEEFIARQTERWESTRGVPSVRFKDIGREGWHVWAREAWTFRIQSNYPLKVLVIERLRRDVFIGQQHRPHGQVGDIEYRLGYYIVGAMRKAVGKWRWGQYAQLIPHFDFVQLLADARADGTILEPWHR